MPRASGACTGAGSPGRERFRRVSAATLSKVDPWRLQFLEYLLVFQARGDGAQSRQLPDLFDRPDHRAIPGIIQHVC